MPVDAPELDISTPPARFEFVTDHDSQHQIRQHVAKLNWRKRREQKQSPQKNNNPRPRPIAAFPIPHRPPSHPQEQPRQQPAEIEDRSSHLTPQQSQSIVPWGPENSISHSKKRHDIASNGLYVDLKHTLILMSPSKKWKLSTVPTTTDAQMSPYHPLNSMDLDPFHTTISLSRDDQRLLHHWVKEYAYVAFGQPTDPTFNPLGNIYVPIDFSHKASVHGILAHAASHIAYLRGERTSLEALQHKMAAIHLVNLALQNEETAVSDENISAVLRLLTYERYWGTEEVWQFHRRGLNQMIKRRGGLSSLSDNWQLETRVHLVALMQRPRWRSPAFISPSSPPGSPDSIADDTEHPHSDFTNFFSDIRSVGPDVAQKYPAIHRATEFLHSLAKNSHTLLVAPGPVDSQEIARLMCLFYIATIMKGANRSHFNLLWLNYSLERTEQVWNNSVEILRWLLVQGVGRGRGGTEEIERTERLKEIALLLNKSSYRNIEERLLDVLVDGTSEDPLLPCE